ncbi:hypothetical protein J3R30DRAFT_3501741 [Lentinula aciculospora]|uniref:Sc15 protein n=1 Tax=Lentinula aciculospora TaxID=153920 RepID=A0A9W9A6M9_9AGAR|nr:hypothetical protein J3R30DRAFT_3501741 [Lentinula aciculospora]
MFSARFFALFFILASFGIVSSVPSSAAVVQERQGITDIELVLNTLTSSTNNILPQITSLGQSGSASEANVTPLINELTAALNTASSSLASLKASDHKVRRESDADISFVVAGLVTDITHALDSILADASHIPTLGPLLSGVDVALDEVLAGVEILLAGVLTLVASLLVNVAKLLNELSFGLTLASLGL